MTTTVASEQTLTDVLAGNLAAMRERPDTTEAQLLAFLYEESVELSRSMTTPEEISGVPKAYPVSGWLEHYGAQADLWDQIYELSLNCRDSAPWATAAAGIAADHYRAHAERLQQRIGRSDEH